MKRPNSWVAVFLAVITVSMLLLSGCDAKKQPKPTGTSSSSEPSEEPSWWEPLGERDLEGKEIRITSRNDGFSQGILEMGQDDYNSSNIVEYAIYQRNTMVEEQYNCFLKVTNNKSCATSLRNEILVNSCSADIIVLSLVRSAAFSDSGLLKNMYTMNELDLENTYWDQNAREELELNQRLDFMCGDMTLMTGQGTWLMIFNKDLITANEMQSPYELVEKNQWTADEMWSMACLASEDLDGNGTRDQYDRYGLLVQTADVQMLYQAFGEHYTQKNSEGELKLVLGQTSRASDVFDKIASMFADQTNTLVSNRFDSTSQHTINIQMPCFTEGRALFYISGVLRLFELRSSSMKYGLLPLPKYHADQDRYYHPVKGNWGSGVSIPRCVSEPETVAFVLEAIAAASAEVVQPAYYDLTLGTNLVKDPDSRNMLGVVLNSITYDVLTLYNWKDILGILNSIGTSNTSDFKSTVDSMFTSVEEAMKDTVNSRE